MAGAATVEKALDVLFHLHAAGDSQGLSEIGRALALPKSSCHRLLASLVDREVVEQDAFGRYRPGLALLSLGIGAQSREPAVAAARPVLEDEARALEETVFLVGLRHGRLRVLDKVEGSGFLRAAPDVGDVVPMDVTAAGKLYQVYDEPLSASVSPVASSASTVGTDHLPQAERRAIEAQGYAVNRDAWIEGVSVLGVPIFRASLQGQRELSAVLALAAASSRFDGLGEARISRSLIEASDRVGARLGLANVDEIGSGRRARERAERSGRGLAD